MGKKVKETNVQVAMESALISALTEFKTIVFNRLDDFEKRLVVAGQPVNRPAPPIPTKEDIVKSKLSALKEPEKIDMLHNSFKGLETNNWNKQAIDSLCMFILLSDSKTVHKTSDKKLVDKTAPGSDCKTCKLKDKCKVQDVSKCRFNNGHKKQVITSPVTSDKKQELVGRQAEVWNMLKSGMTLAQINEATGKKCHGTVYALKQKGYNV